MSRQAIVKHLPVPTPQWVFCPAEPCRQAACWFARKDRRGGGPMLHHRTLNP
ncbi:hypothetical protein ACFOWZ_33175 [Lentzea rhizosphaerae]|uniref:Uncharacterized protein n=1 Tax=Lentzea rhizosphaerae TaxID=2041025 RepID=A0ABV8C328_9PSEU